MAVDAAPARQRSGFSLAVGDALATSFFVFVSSTFEEVAQLVGPALGLPGFAASLGILVAGLIVFGPVAEWLGGPGTLFNPSHNLAFAAVGQGKRRTHAMRMVFQILGGILGAAAALIFIPIRWQRNFYKMALVPQPGVSVKVAILSEAALTFLLNIVILYATTPTDLQLAWFMDAGARNKYLAYWAPLVATVALVVSGAELTGPSMNPAFTFGWFTQFGSNSWHEHFLVFWLGPLLGGLMAGLTWRAFVVAKPSQRQQNTVVIVKSKPSSAGRQAGAQSKDD